MKSVLVAFSTSIVLILTGCATSGAPEVEADALHYELSYQVGVITDIKPVVVKDTGNGGLLGTVVGGILGSMIGNGRGSTLGFLGGGLIGMYVGNEAGKSNAQELSVALDNNQDVIVLSKGNEFMIGQRIKIVKRNGRVYNVEHF
ncbi:MAG: glycine zipper 2TM domain-containing protein [Campylobacterales bacterium]|nr:glycine zipper 2TM domain-containing protein [Campylobacterales bacterium]